MKKIVNDILPSEGFTALTIWPLVFVRRSKERLFTEVMENHEKIHARQQIEMLVAGSALAIPLYFIVGWWCLLALPIFFWIYGLEYVVRLVICRDRYEAYFSISFEREAYANQSDAGYLRNRKWYAWTHYLCRRSFPLSQNIFDRI